MDTIALTEEVTHLEVTDTALNKLSEVVKGGPLPSMPELMRDKKPTLKYLTVTSMFNRERKRELALKLTRQNRKRRAIRSVLCSTCQLSFTAKTAARCQCPVIKPARKPANAN